LSGTGGKRLHPFRSFFRAIFSIIDSRGGFSLSLHEFRRVIDQPGVRTVDHNAVLAINGSRPRGLTMASRKNYGTVDVVPRRKVHGS
jgi:hypothetical protein